MISEITAKHFDKEYHIIELNYNMPPEAYEWLKNQFGPSGERWFCSFKRVYFLNKHDHFMFLLRWA